MTRDRYHAIRLAGARALDLDSWAKLVASAVERAQERHRHRFSSDAAPSDAPTPIVRRFDVCAPDQMPVRYQTILDVELHIAEIGILRDELRGLAESEDVSQARHERIARKLEAAMATVKRRLQTGQA